MTQAKQFSLRAVLPGIVSFCIVVGVIVYILNTIGLDRLQQIILESGPIAPLIYIGVRILTIIAAPLTSGPIQMFAGVVFGFVPGVIYSLIGETIGGSINFWIARKLGRPVVERIVGTDGMEKVEKFYQQNTSIWTLIYARVFLFSIYDFISYAVGLTPVRYRQYLLVSAVFGAIPISVGVLVGTKLTELGSGMMFLFAGLGLICLIPLLLYRPIRRLFKRDEPTPLQNPSPQ